MYVKVQLAHERPAAKRLYDQLADLLGAAGVTALDMLLEDVWYAALDGVAISAADFITRTPEAARMRDRIAALVGADGTAALDKLLPAVWFAAVDATQYQ